MTEVLTGLLALLAGGFALAAGLGVLRFPDALTRMHASSKVGSFASALALLAAAVDIGGVSAASRAGFAILFLLMTAPIGAHLLGRAAMWRAGRAPRPSPPRSE
ncbi:cation:proton antiporter [Falsirhodobacter halotolerans]|uniref:cation:proton antiporter n=1 Tax=Falsirhodobacter halotolerans TaxID=1146892 RepID=UPI001FD0F0C4|nr:monovalent cation/H(+) antiporter subunit G [Falsirhodobacter halotolerans]MCJ8140349.1 monovalent cation/H(+) antiporter subunit G [Falsirhodobacter halotolerans]